ncbi:MAG TPA: glycosyltransferase, partial [Mycobacteriales bacterium]|nr:glycosyltransferase [Mycobacteriales bacterium]
ARRRRPSGRVAGRLVALVRSHRIDVVHGYEWPPGVEAFFGPGLRTGASAVCTVMSMSVAPFLPRGLPLVVGTEEIRRAALRAGHRRVSLLEPPVDTRANHPGHDGAEFRAQHGLPADAPLVVVVSRLAPELKLEGLLAACQAVGDLSDDRSGTGGAAGSGPRLVVVGDGPARAEVERAAARANAAAGAPVVTLTGALADPRGAYAAADVVLGMGGSALRGLAFGKPLVVQGERGFWALLTADSAPAFLRQGWYGVGGGGPAELAAILRSLLADPPLRDRLGRYGRELVVERFSLARAAAVQEDVYRRVRAERAGPPPAALDAVRTGGGLLGYKLRRRYQRLRGTVRTDDFNAVTVGTGPVPAGRPNEES